MRFSLTGDQAAAALLVESIVQSTSHSLDVMEVRGRLEAQLQEVAVPDCRRVTTSEEVLIASDVETVIIAESRADESIQLARQASQADCHVVVIPPADLSTAWSYELHLLLDESRYGLVVLTGRWYLATTDPVTEELADCQLGLPSVADDSDSSATLMHAIDVCSSLGFADSQITVLGDGDGAKPVNRQVVLSGTGADGSPRPSVTLNCSRTAEKFVLRGRAGIQSIDLPVFIPGHGEALPEETSAVLADGLAAALPDAAACQQSMEQLSRTLQVMEAVAKSARRRRTVDVYADELTERSVFKTQMTAIGCGVLTWMMFGMIGYLLVAQLFKPPAGVMQVLRALWIAPVGIFLLAQLLLPLARGRQSAGSNGLSSATDGSEEASNHD